MIDLGDGQERRQIPCPVCPDVVGRELGNETLALRPSVIDDDNPMPRSG
ncbi:MAG: hypothetical protein NTY24_13320 [Mycobacterium sp.]|nr:hypothetical protein [Mycobacterium sp.]MCX6481318.1 hypothetical protein [Mycobacterium sp.]